VTLEAQLRLATSADAQAIAIVHRTAVRVSLPFLPELHTAEDDLHHFSSNFLPANQVWVAEAGGRVVGYIGFDAAFINHLYLLPQAQGQGLGDRLLAKALEGGRPRQLWTFQANARARRFYERRGFVVVRFTDGAGNEEKTPDVLYQWRGPAAPGPATTP
jgi:GNAT superfamily N-acetyltransferase